MTSRTAAAPAASMTSCTGPVDEWARQASSMLAKAIGKATLPPPCTVRPALVSSCSTTPGRCRRAVRACRGGPIARGRGMSPAGVAARGTGCGEVFEAMVLLHHDAAADAFEVLTAAGDSGLYGQVFGQWAAALTAEAAVLAQRADAATWMSRAEVSSAVTTSHPQSLGWPRRGWPARSSRTSSANWYPTSRLGGGLPRRADHTANHSAMGHETDDTVARHFRKRSRHHRCTVPAGTG